MFDVEQIVQGGGILLVCLIVFAESGLLLGFFLPGDTLLFAAGFLAGQDKLPIELLVAGIILSAIIGYQVGYLIGEKAGPRVFTRKDGVLFRQDHIKRTSDFFDRHGVVTVTLARFVPIVRTFVSTVAGVGGMDRRKFFIYNVIGALLWGGGITLLGYWLGNAVPHFDKYLVPLALIAVFGSLGLAVLHLLRDAGSRQNLISGLKADFRYMFGRDKD